MTRRIPIILFMAIAALAAIIASHNPTAMAKPTPEDPFAVVRGMTVSCQTNGREWGTDAMIATMDELKSLGVNWIAIHPYVGVRNDGTVGGRRSYLDVNWITRPIAEAHKRGLKIMIKPHMAYWGSGFSWAGDISFETAEQWKSFFDGYEKCLLEIAAASKDADAFGVGSELDKTITHEAEWRRIIKSVREALSPGVVITYAANWDAYERVPFWDAVDVVCVHGYFPLTDQQDLPGQESLDQAWRKLVSKLDDFGARQHRKIVLGELGYDCSMTAAIRPWESMRHHRQRRDAASPDAEELQARCLSAALKAINGSQSVTGAFLWKWFPGGDDASRGENFLMSTPAMRHVIAKYWAVGSPP